MAEFVHRRTESMLQELEQMERVKLFSHKEVQAIIKKRTAHEYKLVRRTKDKKDFLAYIQYEIILLDLIHKRRERENYYFKKDEIEYAIVSRIHSLFKQLTQRWAHDLKLWFSHAQFCLKWKKKTQLGKLCSKFLQIHGSKPKHWILAAKWQFECSDLTENARAIFLQATKNFPDDQQIWLKYFRAELLFAEKLKKRLLLLTGGNEDKTEHSMGRSENLLLNGEAARIAYRRALEAVPDNASFQVKFLDIISLFSCNKFALDISEDIKRDLMATYPDKPKVIAALAKLHLKPGVHDFENSDWKSAFGRCCEKFEKAILVQDTEEMWGEYFDCVRCLFERDEGKKAMTTRERFYDVANRAHVRGKLSSARGIFYISALQSGGFLHDAFAVASTLLEKRSCCLKIVKKQTELGFLLNEIEANFADEAEMLASFFKRNYDESGKKEDALELYMLWMRKAIADDDFELARRVFDDALLRIDRNESIPLQELYFRVLAHKDGAQKALEVLFSAPNQLKSPTLAQYQLVLNLLSAGHSQDQVEKVFERALRDHGSEVPDLWLDFISFKHSRGGFHVTQVGEVHWRALKNLRPALAQEFVSKYSMLQL